MKTFVWLSLHNTVSDSILKYGTAYDTLEFWLDTSSAKLAKQSPSMYLVFYAFTNHSDFESVIQKAQLSDDMSLIEDNIKLSTDQTWFELAQISNDLSTGEGFIANSGVNLIIEQITLLLKSDSKLFNQFSKVFLHWVDNSEVYWIKK